jgi:DNA recombination protein RmuC
VEEEMIQVLALTGVVLSVTTIVYLLITRKIIRDTIPGDIKKTLSAVELSVSDAKSQIKDIEEAMAKTITSLEFIEKSVKDEFQRNRIEMNDMGKASREELSKSLEGFSNRFSDNVKQLNDFLKDNYNSMRSQQIDFFKQVIESNKDIKQELSKEIGAFGNSFAQNVKGLNDLLKSNYDDMKKQQVDFYKQVTDGNVANREEMSKSFNSFEVRLVETIKELNELLRQKFGDFAKQQTDLNKQNTENVKEVKESVEKQLTSIREDNTKQLEEMRRTVDEKLQKTINERLSQSFETVGRQLQAVQEGLGEMKNLASDVGGLKKVLSNVRIRGGIGEIQLSMLLEQILAPEQYATNVMTKTGSSETVEFAVKLPGKGDSGSVVWLPIDAKFPKDVYEKLQEAYDEGEPMKILAAQRGFENAIKKMAKDIRDKYIDPPNTTDFGIMFLPFEGIYAEVVRKAALLEELHVKFKIMVTGPTTLAVILNSLQIGFKTLAIEKRSSEVWQILGAVKKEFGNFKNVMEKAQKNIQTGLNQLDDVVGRRTRVIQSKLRSVEELGETEAKQIFPELTDTSHSNN